MRSGSCLRSGRWQIYLSVFAKMADRKVNFLLIWQIERQNIKSDLPLTMKTGSSR